MKNIILFDSHDIHENLLPITFTRPVSDIRLGILTIMDKWKREFPEMNFSYLTIKYLQEKFELVSDDDSLFIAGNIIPDTELVESISQLNQNEALIKNNEVLAFRGNKDDFCKEHYEKKIEYENRILAIKELYDIFMLNDEAIKIDFHKLTSGRASQPLSITNTVVGNPYFEDGTSKIFIEEGAIVEGTFLNVKHGPIYIGKDVEIMEASAIRAPFAACEHATVNMGTKIYGATTLGPYCKVGGELNNVVMIGYSNKAHEGFLGNSVIGEWCNLGGGTTASNLKNDYSEIKLWNYNARRFLKTGLQFCGLIMGDHSKAGINCMFNTATVIGVGVNIYGSGFPRNFVPSFSEGSTAGYTDVSLVKFFAIAERMMSRRNKTLNETDRKIFEAIYLIADNYK